MPESNTSSFSNSNCDSSGEAFGHLFELTNDIALLLEPNSLQILDANPQASESLGYPRERLLQLDFDALSEEKSKNTLIQFSNDEKEHLEGFSGHLRRCGNSEFPCEIKFKKLTSPSSAILMIARDISAQIRTNEDIHLRNVAIASVTSGVTIADARTPDLPLIYVNQGFQTITGYSAKEAIGRNCRFLQGNDRHQEDLEILRNALKEGQSCTVRLRNYRKDGQPFVNELHISPVRNEQGELTHFVGIQLDVTDRVRTREVLERSERRYRQLADSVDDLIVRCSQDGYVQFTSSAARHVLGREPESMVGSRLLNFLHPEDVERVKEHTEHILDHKGPLSCSFRLQHKDGHYLWVESRDSLLEPHNSQSPPLIISVFRDVTLRKKAEQELKQALKHEKELNEIKSSFISLVSHEFRTPMTGIQASAAFLRQFGQNLTAEKRERHLYNIEDALKRMNTMLDEVLFLSRADAGKITIRRKLVKLCDFAERLVEYLEPMFPRRKIILKVSLPSEATFELDDHLLDHILQNLLSNACKYSPKDSEVQFLISKNNDMLLFEVIDSGIGIPKKDQANLFNAFHRATNAENTPGTGLGLNIAQRSVELLGGSITFESEENQGTHFTVKIPLSS